MRGMLILLFVFMLSLRSYSQHSDTLNYAIVVSNDTIGKLIAIRKVNPDNSIVYDVNSIARYKFLFSFNINFDYQTKFDADMIVSRTDFIYKFNGKIKEENKLERNSSGYDIYMEGKFIRSTIGYYSQTALSMYFTEPDISKPILSERFLEPIKIEHLGNHKYRVEFPTEDVNYYQYRDDGICEKISIDMTIVDMEIRLIE
ncbi:MAG: hypothetical protein DRI54_05110 [Bacteroidetes bacterium]|nr:MAG: hypothetical protein DRI54_05110 [Bacteroidota bacterium]